ncbi:Putative GMC oxidoreductase [Podospora comata]|uniref:GMC oxidoreductase n=1 Tax=Podospora comata TaxID=48703 RepID=A0ABY6S8B7_PODCO|nr:Putative GMC oxidoreductase [Podospora comata]
MARVALLLGLNVLGHCLASPHSYSLLHNRDDAHDVYDYVVVGGGTAGLTVADRLSESGKYTVLAIEYGIIEPDGRRNRTNMYNITSVPQVNLNNRTFPVDVGCIVGGSSAVNAQGFQRGTKRDYNNWAELSGVNDSSWNWDDLQPYFRKAIQLGSGPHPDIARVYNMTYNAGSYGTNTSKHSIFATFSRGHTPAIIPIYQALRGYPGVEIPIDHSVGTLGLAWTPRSMEPISFNRSYSRSGHYDGLNRDNYHLLTATRVEKVVFKGKAAEGVEISPRWPEAHEGKGKGKGKINGKGSGKRVIRARKEIVLSAGAIHTPQILQLSGIGPASLLKQAKIPVIVDLPGVGANLQDHAYQPAVQFNWTTPPPYPEVNTTLPPIEAFLFGPGLNLMLGLPGISPTRYQSLAASYLSQSPSEFLPKHIHPTIIAGYAQQQRLYAAGMLDKNFAFSATGVGALPVAAPQLMHGLSRGTVTLNLSFPLSEPIVDYRFASNPLDLDIVAENIKFYRRFYTGPDSILRQYVDLTLGESQPGKGYQSDEGLKGWLRENLVPSVYHPSGTAAKMAREWGGVVNEGLEVYGVKGLSVVDTSIFPTIPGAATSMTVYAVAEKAADLIKARAVVVVGF